MQATNFLYDGVYLSDFGFVVCDFDSKGGVSAVSGGSEITFNKVAHHGGKRYSLSGTKYDECIKTTFDICKDTEKNSIGEMIISDTEYREIFRWLNRRGFHKMAFINDCESDEEYTCYYSASFNISKITVDNVLYGIRLTMETDSPFARGTYHEESFKNVIGSSRILPVDFITDEIGADYADITFTCRSSGTMTITNTTVGSTAVIKNCLVGETIHIDGNTLQITSSRNGHVIANDFSFTFVTLDNTLNTFRNEITASLPCDITIGYTPVVKLTL